MWNNGDKVSSIRSWMRNKAWNLRFGWRLLAISNTSVFAVNTIESKTNHYGYSLIAMWTRSSETVVRAQGEEMASSFCRFEPNRISSILEPFQVLRKNVFPEKSVWSHFLFLFFYFCFFINDYQMAPRNEISMF